MTMQFLPAVIQSDRVTRDQALVLVGNLESGFYQKYGVFGPSCHLVGSCEIQGEGNDADIMVLVYPEQKEFLAIHLLTSGWIEQAGDVDEYGIGDFRSFRLANMNILMVWDKEVAKKWIAAVEVCKFINTRTREQRVAIHKIIMDGECAADQDMETV